MARKLNVIFGFLLVILFVTEASMIQQWHILLGLVLSTVCSLIAFVFRYLTLDGMFSAIIVAMYVLGLGGWPAAFVLLLFFVSSAIVSVDRDHKSVNHRDPSSRRGKQVWANGFWLVIMLILASVFDTQFYTWLFVAAGMGALATATADTWATEVGLRFSNSSYLITNFRKMPAGTDGGVSLSGTVASIVGSLLISFASVYFFAMNFPVFFCIFVAGFLGSVADSYFGALFQRNNSSAVFPVLQKSIIVDNNIVNALATGVGALLTITINLIFL